MLTMKRNCLCCTIDYSLSSDTRNRVNIVPFQLIDYIASSSEYVLCTQCIKLTEMNNISFSMLQREV